MRPWTDSCCSHQLWSKIGAIDVVQGLIVTVILYVDFGA